MKDLLILRRIHLSKAPATFIRPTWWQKKVKNLKKVFLKQFFHFFPIRMASWQPGTLLKWKILKFRIYWCYLYLRTTKFDRLGDKRRSKTWKITFLKHFFSTFSYQDGFLSTWDPFQMKDLKILHRIHLTRSLYDGIWPTLCPSKVRFFPILFIKTSFFHKPLFPTSFALLDITNGKMGNAIYVLFIH